MNRYTLLLTFLLSLMFSSPSYSAWMKFGESVRGNTFYVDFERIRKVDGYVYYWILTDLLKPTKSGDLSFKIYYQGDCKLFRYKYLSYSFHKEPMGGGTGRVDNVSDKNWQYPPPNSNIELALKSVCNHIGE